MDYEGRKTSSRDILAWLNGGGYGCVLEYDGNRRAYVTDEDDDMGYQRVAVAAVRRLIANGSVAIWRKSYFNTYRPTWWVKQWNEQRPNEQDSNQP